MPLVKYRINKDKVKKVMVDSSITASDFIEIINKESTERVTKSVFRGKILEDDELIFNQITESDQVLILLTDDDSKACDLIDLEDEIKENQEEIENEVSSSLFQRNDSNQNRRGIKFTFTIYTTATPESMLKGTKVDFKLNDTYSTCYKTIQKLVLQFPQMSSKNELHIFLPGGVHFCSGTLAEYYTNPSQIAFDNIYVIVTKPAKKNYSIYDEIDEPCSCLNTQRKEILSPLYKSSIDGLTQIASFLGYMFHGGQKRENILISLAKITRFAPLVVNLYRLIENRKLNALNILAITAPLFTLFRSVLQNNVKMKKFLNTL